MWIKDRQKKLDTKQKRDTCRYYSYRSGGCTVYKILACHNCIGYKKKINNGNI